MSDVTTTRNDTLYEILRRCDPNQLADALRQLGVAKMSSIVKVVASSLSASASFDITTADVKAASTISGLSLRTGENLPAAGDVVSLRCTASGTANSVGSYAIGDASSTAISPTAGANVGLAKLSDDGKTITFPTTVTAFELHYRPRFDADPSSAIFAPSS